MAGEDRTARVGLRQQFPYQRREGVQRGGHVVEGVGPAPREGVVVATAPVLGTGHGESAAGEEARERADVTPVVRRPPGTAVQHEDDRGGPARAGLPARGVEVDHLVGVVAVGGGGVGTDGLVGEHRLLLGSGPCCCDVVRHAPTFQRNVRADQ